jgi:hypothetical protein
MMFYLLYYLLPGARKRREALRAATCGDPDCWICNYDAMGIKVERLRRESYE